MCFRSSYVAWTNQWKCSKWMCERGVKTWLYPAMPLTFFSIADWFGIILVKLPGGKYCQISILYLWSWFKNVFCVNLQASRKNLAYWEPTQKFHFPNELQKSHDNFWQKQPRKLWPRWPFRAVFFFSLFPILERFFEVWISFNSSNFFVHKVPFSLTRAGSILKSSKYCKITGMHHKCTSLRL